MSDDNYGSYEEVVEAMHTAQAKAESEYRRGYQEGFHEAAQGQPPLHIMGNTKVGLYSCGCPIGHDHPAWTDMPLIVKGEKTWAELEEKFNG